MNHFNFKPVYWAVLSAILASCAAVGPDYKRAELALPAQYRMANASNQSNQDMGENWWQAFNDATLNDLMTQAIANNLDVRKAVARIEEADAYAREVGAALLPSVSLDANAARSRITTLGATPLFNGVNPQRNDFKVSVGTQFELDFWGKFRRAKEGAAAQALSSRYAKDTVDLTLKSNVANQYFTLRSLDAQIALAQTILDAQDKTLTLTKNRLAGGVASGLDVYQAESNTENFKAQIADLIKQRALAEHQLQVLTGNLTLELASLNTTELPAPPVPPAGLPSALLESRPDIRQAEQDLIAANANIGVAKAALYPSISLTANYGGQSADLGDILKSGAKIWTLGFGLNLPIFNSGRLNAKVDQVTAQQKQSLYAYQGAIQAAFREVNDALVTLQQNRQREEAFNNSQIAAKKALDIAQNRYQSGYSAYLDLLDAQRTYDNVAISYVQSRQARLLAVVQLYKVLGGGWQAGQ